MRGTALCCCRMCGWTGPTSWTACTPCSQVGKEGGWGGQPNAVLGGYPGCWVAAVAQQLESCSGERALHSAKTEAGCAVSGAQSPVLSFCPGVQPAG